LFSSTGFEGLHCENNIDDCIGVDCPAGLVCVDLANAYECQCPKGFTGAPACDVDIDECQSNPCQNEGTCWNKRGGYACACTPGYTGKNCENDVDECEVLKPCVHGICENKVGEFDQGGAGLNTLRLQMQKILIFPLSLVRKFKRSELAWPAES
jgi:hypothetical protein